jgi:hypothetical protein
MGVVSDGVDVDRDYEILIANPVVLGCTRS